MAIIQLLSLTGIALLLMTMLTQARPWIKAKVAGKVIQTSPMNLWQRIRFYRSSLLALAMGLLLGRTAGWLPDGLVVMAACFGLLIVCFPMKYTFTTQGVAVGAAVFRPWSEFSGISLKSDRIVLDHPSYFGRLTLFAHPAELGSILSRFKKSSIDKKGE